MSGAGRVIRVNVFVFFYYSKAATLYLQTNLPVLVEWMQECTRQMVVSLESNQPTKPWKSESWAKIAVLVQVASTWHFTSTSVNNYHHYCCHNQQPLRICSCHEDFLLLNLITKYKTKNKTWLIFTVINWMWSTWK